MKNKQSGKEENAHKPISKKEFPSDVLGSYTGKPISDDEVPEQDADDL